MLNVISGPVACKAERNRHTVGYVPDYSIEIISRLLYRYLGDTLIAGHCASITSELKLSIITGKYV